MEHVIGTSWISVAVAALGIAGTLTGVLLTLRSANQREDLRWEREQARLQAEAERRQGEEHAAWLRDKRLEAYAELVRLSQQFWMHLMPLIDVLERQDDPRSELNRIRLDLFASVDRCKLLAGTELQLALYQLEDAAENVGHRPYEDDRGRENQWRHQLLHDAQAASKQVEAAVRSELKLAPRAPYRRGPDDRT